MTTVAVIVGSGALDLGSTHAFAPADCGRETPFGQASTVPLLSLGAGPTICLLARHGDDHRLAPHQINYRANVYLLDQLGVQQVVAINTVGGIAAHAVNGGLVLPDQLIDYSWGRKHSFADAEDLRHVDFAEPYDAHLRGALLAAARVSGVALHDGGVYGCTQGPRFESAAEILRMERDGCTLVGMTGMPEAGLARELGLAYASVCLVVNPAAGKGPSIDLDEIAAIAEGGMREVGELLRAFFEGLELQP